MESVEKELQKINLLLKEIRKEKDITQISIAEKTGLSKQMVSKMESNIGNPTLASLIKYCDCIGIDLYEAIKNYYYKQYIPMYNNSIVLYNIGDKVRTKIHYLNDKRTEVEAIIRGVELDDKTNIIRYKIRFEPEEFSKKQGCTGCHGYVDQNDIISIIGGKSK